MKKLTLPILIVAIIAFPFVSAFAEIKVSENLSISGFLDMSSTMENDGKDTTVGASFDQFEVDFHYNYGSVTGRADIDSTGGENGSTMTLEQGFVTYTIPESILPGASITAGRFLSSLGFETAEPTGLFQYSFSEGIPYPGYQNGVAISLSPTKQFGIYASVLSGVWNVNDTDLKDPGFEAQVSVTPVEQVTAKVGFALEKMTLGKKEETRSELNAWVSFAQGPLTFAGEIDILGNWEAIDKAGKPAFSNGLHFLGMANVALADVISQPIALTVRFSGITLNDGFVFGNNDTSTEITFSPSFAPTDNWTLLAEVRRLIDQEVTQFAVESLFTF